MNVRRFRMLTMTSGLVALVVVTFPALAEEIHGTVKSVDPISKRVILTDDAGKTDYQVEVTKRTADASGKKPIVLKSLKPGTKVIVTNTITASKIAVDEAAIAHGTAGSGPGVSKRGILGDFWYNFRHNLFKPLLLFFYLGFLVPILRVKFEFPYVMYQGLTIYLLLAIGWHGGEELAAMDPKLFASVFGFMTVGFITNTFIGIIAYLLLNAFTKMRKVDKATVAGYYGSDSAGTFVTCLGVLASTHILYDAYMPVMLAVMEIPGCLVALYLVSRLRHQGMDALGNMPFEEGYDPKAVAPLSSHVDEHGHGDQAVEAETELALEKMEHPDNGNGNGNGKKPGLISGKLLHEVFLNSGLYLLFGGIAIGFISGLQGPEVTRADDSFFVTLFQGILCLFLLEMGMTASRKLKDLRMAGWPFVAFGILAPNLFATIGILVAHAFSTMTGTHFELGSYVLFAVLCGASSYIAVPAVQRMAIPEASPTLPLAASLGLTFSYNVTIGIPVYIEIAKLVQRLW